MGGLCSRIRNSPKFISTARAVNKKTTLIPGEEGDKFIVFIVADESTPRSIWAIGRITNGVFTR